MIRDRLPWIPWVLVGLTAVVAAVEFAVTVENHTTVIQTAGLAEWLGGGLLFVLPVSFAGVGAFILTRRPGNRIGWLMIAVGLGFAIGTLTTDYPHLDVSTHQPTRPLASSVAWIQAWIWFPTYAALLLLLLLFPTGEFPSRRWTPVAWIGGVSLVILGILGAIARGPIQNVPFENPYGLVSVPDPVGGLGAFIALGALVAAALSLVLRFRTAEGVVRQQMKWFTFGASLAIPLNIATNFVGWNSVVGVGALLTEASLPVVMGIAILRYRLYDIDVLINRTLVYGSLSATLGGLYILSVVVLQDLFRVAAGQSSEIAVMISTLSIAALFQPLRRRIQALIDRRFYRRKYDAVQTLASFQTRLRDEVNLDQLSSDLTGVVRDTMQPTHVSLWLR